MTGIGIHFYYSTIVSSVILDWIISDLVILDLLSFPKSAMLFGFVKMHTFLPEVHLSLQSMKPHP